VCLQLVSRGSTRKWRQVEDRCGRSGSVWTIDWIHAECRVLTGKCHDFIWICKGVFCLHLEEYTGQEQKQGDWSGRHCWEWMCAMMGTCPKVGEAEVGSGQIPDGFGDCSKVVCLQVRCGRGKVSQSLNQRN
jgi:hypothetical protein